jgi:hypothetical protein
MVVAFDVEAIAMPRHSEVAKSGQGIPGMSMRLQHLCELSLGAVGLRLT